MKHACRVILCCAMLHCAAVLLLGQGERGTLDGIITDPAGAVVPKARVVAVNTDTGVETATEATESGVYRLPYLPPGNYRILVSAPGFRTALRENVILRVAQTLTVNFKLELGLVAETVTVSSTPPAIETGTAEIGRYATRDEIDQWPITVSGGRRQMLQFIFTALPGTSGGVWSGTINGGQLFSHEILVDGISVGRFDIQGGSTSEFSPSVESISEFKLQTGVIGAQYSGGQTAVANFATRGGTNELHMSAYFHIQNDVLRANSWTNNAAGIRRMPYKQHHIGVSGGGPIRLGRLYDGRNKSFFFADFEYTRLRDFNSLGFGTLPTKDFKQGNFARLLNPQFTGNANSGKVIGTDRLGRPVVFGALYDPATSRQVNGQWVRDPFPGNIIPAASMSPVSKKILETAGIDDPLFDTMLNNIPVISVCCPVFGEKTITLRGDHHLSDTHHIAATVYRNFRARNNSAGGRWGMPPGLPTGVYRWQQTPGTMGRIAYDWSVSPSILTHIAIGYNRFGNKNQSVFVDQGWPQKIGLENVPGTHFPALFFNTGAAYQGRGIGGADHLGDWLAGGTYNGSTIILGDTTIIRGRHSLKVGFEHRRYYYNDRPRSNESGSFYFSPLQTALPGFNTQTGHAFASFLLGAVASANRSVVTSYFGHRWRPFGFYIMDDWKATRKLTLNLGLRWDIVPGLTEVGRRMANFDPSKPNPAAGNVPGALVWLDELKRASFQNNYLGMLAPKFGLAYAMTDKLVFRAGYGINNTTPVSNDWGFAGGYGFNGTINLSSTTVPLNYAEEPVHWLHKPFPNFAGALPDKNPSIQNGTGVNYYAPDSNRLAYLQSWSIGFQYALPKEFVADVNYVGNKGTRLEAEGFDELNGLPYSFLSLGQLLTDPWKPSTGIREPFPGFKGTVLQALRPYPQYTSVTQQFANLGTSIYHSLQAQLTRHFQGGFAMLAAYTWSKWISLSESALNGVTPVDLFNRKLNRVINASNVPHYMKVTWIYDLPFGRGKWVQLRGPWNQIFGGWSMSANHHFRSGTPLSIRVGGLATNPLGAAYPDLVPGEKIVINPDAPINFRGVVGGEAYLNRNAFALPPIYPGGRNVIQRPGTLGPILPNVRGPHLVSEDIAISKTWRMSEHRSFELQGVFLNPFNRHGRGGPVTDLSSPFFGQITGSQQAPRNIELSARISF